MTPSSSRTGCTLVFNDGSQLEVADSPERRHAEVVNEDMAGLPDQGREYVPCELCHYQICEMTVTPTKDVGSGLLFQ